jgi:hypothetical protein
LHEWCSAWTRVDSITACGPSPDLVGPPWHGRGQGFEFPKLHSLFLLIRLQSHPCDFTALFCPHWTRGKMSRRAGLAPRPHQPARRSRQTSAVAARHTRPHRRPSLWGPYLAGRSHLIAELTDQVRLNVAGKAPPWAAKRRAAVPAELIADIQVWRAATQVDPSDLRPTGPLQLGRASRVFQQQLESDSPPRTPTQSHTGGNCSRRKSPA